MGKHGNNDTKIPILQQNNQITIRRKGGGEEKTKKTEDQDDSIQDLQYMNANFRIVFQLIRREDLEMTSHEAIHFLSHRRRRSYQESSGMTETYDELHFLGQFEKEELVHYPTKKNEGWIESMVDLYDNDCEKCAKRLLRAYTDQIQKPQRKQT